MTVLKVYFKQKQHTELTIPNPASPRDEREDLTVLKFLQLLSLQVTPLGNLTLGSTGRAS